MQKYKKKAKFRARIQLFIINLQTKEEKTTVQTNKMSNSFFRFKRFCIHHDCCAMKVGTDGVLLGAWGCVEGKRILDVGTGTGLIALMAAQRNPEAIVLGIDIDEQAVFQAQENIAESPFNKRISCILQDVLTFQSETTFDAILCNPPFFTEDTMPVDTVRALARNNKSLPFSELIPKVASLLTTKGTFSVIIPCEQMQEFIGLCLAYGLHLSRRCYVHTVARKPARRTLLTFAVEKVQSSSDSLFLLTEDGNRSQAYKELTEAFYL